MAKMCSGIVLLAGGRWLRWDGKIWKSCRWRRRCGDFGLFDEDGKRLLYVCISAKCGDNGVGRRRERSLLGLLGGHYLLQGVCCLGCYCHYCLLETFRVFLEHGFALPKIAHPILAPLCPVVLLSSNEPSPRSSSSA